MSGELGKASLDLEANLTSFEANIKSGGHTVEGFDRQLAALASIADAANKALGDVGISAGQAAESRASAASILEGVHGLSDEARDAARELDQVKITEEQAAESEVAGGLIDRILNSISRNADEAKRKLLEVKLAGGRNGVGVGPFGSGFGRIGVLGAGIGVGALTAPAAVPAAIGLLASIPTLAIGGVGALGTLALAFDGVTKAIGGDKKAFDDLSPSAQKFVLTVRSLDDWFDKLRATAAKGLFPGLTGGLKAALSPGTVSAITVAVAALAHAIGMAGLEWGRFFGSSEFQHILGPLMASAARNIGVLSDGFLHLFDALGVLARAAIPFTNWLVDTADKGAKFADSWIHAKDASGQLAHGLSEAQTSLRLVGELALSLLRVVGALGQALYPVAKVAIKALTDGLNALSGIIHRNEGDIRGIVGGALRVFVVAVGAAATGVGALWRGLEDLIGHKATVIAAIAAIGAVIALSLGPESAAIAGALIAVGLIKKNWRTVAKFFVTLGLEILNSFKFVWYELEKGALKAALAVVEPFSHLPSFLGGWARKAKNSMQGQLDKLQPPDMNWSDNAARAGAITGNSWADAYESTISARLAKAKRTGGMVLRRSGTYVPPSHPHHHRHTAPTTATPSTDVFGPPPPFTKNTGSGSGSHKPPVIPGSVSFLDAQAARQDQQASALNYAGKAAREHLDKEITDLQKADRILQEKLKNATGKQRTELYKALTENLKKIDEARKRIKGAIYKARQSSLNFALDQAKAAVDNATQGSKAWDRAIKAEKTALQAEIRYWDKRAHNDKLSKDARDAALRKELSYEKQLKSLTTATAQAASANEQQFLQTFVDIQNAFGGNATPIQPASGKTDTHLHDLKNEARESNRHLKAIRTATRFRGSHAGFEAAMAVTG